METKRNHKLRAPKWCFSFVTQFWRRLKNWLQIRRTWS